MYFYGGYDVIGNLGDDGVKIVNDMNHLMHITLRYPLSL